MAIHGALLVLIGFSVLIGSFVDLFSSQRPPPAPQVQARATFRSEAWVTSVAFSPDGKTLAAGGAAKILLWDVGTGEKRTNLKSHEPYAACVVFSNDGKLLASGGDDGTIKLWDLATGKERITLRGHQARKDYFFRPLFEIDGKRVAFSPDDKILATGGDGTLRLWDLAKGRQIALIQTDTIAVAFSPEGKKLATCGTDVTLWDVASRKKLVTFEHPGHVDALAFSPDSKLLASGSWLGTVKLWDLATRTERATLRRSEDKCVYAVAFSPDGEILAAAEGDRLRFGTWPPGK